MMDDYTRFEIMAEAFRLMTGHMAPGKDAPAMGQSGTYEDRCEAFVEWSAAHLDIVRAMLVAFDRVVPETTASADADRYAFAKTLEGQVVTMETFKSLGAAELDQALDEAMAGEKL